MTITINRNPFIQSLAARPIESSKLDTLSPEAQPAAQALRDADLDGDGQIGNTRAERLAAWRGLDGFDSDRAANTITQGGAAFAAVLQLTGLQGVERSPSLEQLPEAVRAQMAARTQAVPAGARASFERIGAAMERAESGSSFVESQLDTTAGAPASFGRGQLLTSAHLEVLSRSTPEALESLGQSSEGVADMRARGSAAQSWFDALVGSEPAETLPGLSREQTSDARRLAHDGNYDELTQRFGAAFEQSTGLPAGDLQTMAGTNALRDPELRREYATVFRQTHARTSSERLESAAATLAQRHPELAAVISRTGAEGLNHYLTRGDLNENRGGWFTRGAMTSEHWQGFRDRLPEIDRLTSHDRNVEDFNAATHRTGRVTGFNALPAGEQDRINGALARLRHFSPGAFTSAMTPPPASIDELRQRLAGLPPRLQQTMARFATAFDHGLQPPPSAPVHTG